MLFSFRSEYEKILEGHRIEFKKERSYKNKNEHNYKTYFVSSRNRDYLNVIKYRI